MVIDYNYSMIINRQNLSDKKETAEKMYYLVNRYFRDLSKFKTKKNGKIVPVTELNIIEFFDLVRSIPYRKDVKPIEVVSRPKYILKFRKSGADCKKKGILMGAYLKYNNLPYRFMSSSRKPSGRIHHVFPQIFINGKWKNLDATYSHYKPFQKKIVTNSEVL